jgi:UDP-glucose 4-epimerase
MTNSKLSIRFFVQAKAMLWLFCVFFFIVLECFSSSIHAKTILVTGGTGYIGSHVSVELLNAGYDVVIVDDNRNSKREVLERIKKITKKEVKFYHVNLTDQPDRVREIFERHKFFAVIHLAGLKSVKESTLNPLLYYRENLLSTINLLESMLEKNCVNIIFSSSATVYGNPVRIPMDENHPRFPVNPYGNTKLVIENMLEDTARSRNDFQAIALRYFNPIGAHTSGELGEEPSGMPNNLMPLILNVINGKEKVLNVYTGYDTRDGTGIRDYIHVVDLAKGHVAALHRLESQHKPIHFRAYNLGTGRGRTAQEIVNAVNKALNRNLPIKKQPRRSGDVDILVADPRRAQHELNWTARLSLDDMVQDSLKWAYQTKTLN